MTDTANPLADMLELRNMTARALATELGISEGAVSLYAQGKRTPKVDVALHIARILACDVRDLFPRRFHNDGTERRTAPND